MTATLTPSTTQKRAPELIRPEAQERYLNELSNDDGRRWQKLHMCKICPVGRGTVMTGPRVTALRLRILAGRFDTGAREIELGGRIAWAIGRLIEAGARGCTAIEMPTPRWSSYVHRLRSVGFDIETIHTPHRGAYPSSPARYVLLSAVEVISEEWAAA